MKLTKEQYLSKYSEAVRKGVKSKDCPTWEHLPAGHMYFARYERDSKPEPGEAAGLFLAETVWGQAPRPRKRKPS